MKTIMGYSDRISACPGETVKFMVSCEGQAAYRARLVRVIHGDTSPDGPGYKEEAVASSFEGDYDARKQEIHSGSFAVVPANRHFDGLGSFTLQMMVWPTTVEKGTQTICALRNGHGGAVLGIDESGALSVELLDDSGGTETLSTGKPMLSREWYFAGVSYDAASGELNLYQEPLVPYAKVDSKAAVSTTSKVKPVFRDALMMLAASPVTTDTGRVVGRHHMNGKIDRPRLSRRALSRLDMERLRGDIVPQDLVSAMVGVWDFSKDISSEKVSDTSPNRLHGETVNMPVRGMKGHNWTGEEMCWRHKPEQYGAIHFHDDDLYDSQWEVDFEFTVPEGLKSGLYAAHIATEHDEDFIPFVIRPPRGTKQADLLFVIPTASYMAYANEHMMTDAPLAEHLTDQVVTMQNTDVFLHEHREFGASCYDTHSDGSGVCYTSRLRPILTMRPKYQSWLKEWHGRRLAASAILWFPRVNLDFVA